jgi:hypothetical protein
MSIVLVAHTAVGRLGLTRGDRLLVDECTEWLMMRRMPPDRTTLREAVRAGLLGPLVPIRQNDVALEAYLAEAKSDSDPVSGRARPRLRLIP